MYRAIGLIRQAASVIVSFALLIGGFAGTLFGIPEDTEEAYREKVASVDCYENTIETAIPQTAIYDMITAHYASPLPEGKTEKKAIVIGYDGGRADSLAYIQPSDAIQTMLGDGGHAYIGYCGGVEYPAENIQATSTAPGWCSIMTGVWADSHGVTGNGVPKTNEYLSLFTTLVESKAADSSAFYTMWGGHFVDSDSTYINEKAYCEEKGLAVSFAKSTLNTGTVEKTINDVSSNDCSDFIFSIIEFQDSAGHATGFSTFNPIYQFGTRLTDSAAQRIIDAIKARTTFGTEDWLIVLTSDHGGVGTGHGGPEIQPRMTFIVANQAMNYSPAK